MLKDRPTAPEPTEASPALDALDRRIGDSREALIALTQDLIRIPTVNPPGDAYTSCAELIGNRLRGRGFSVAYHRAEGAPGDSARYPRTNVIARIESGRPGPTVHFNSHIDVVEAGAGWTVDPFGGVVREGRVYGRGACDMKGGLAASIVAVESILEAEHRFNGAIEISGTVDEESGGYGGVAWLAARGHFSKPRVDYVIIPEPLDPDRICIGHRGVWWGEVETLGRIAHGSMPFLGVSAIRHMGLFLAALESSLLPALGRRRTAMPVVPEGARVSTLNVNSIHGGQPDFTCDDGAAAALPSPCVADRCRVVLDRRFVIEESAAGVEAELRALLDRLEAEVPDFRYRLRQIWTVDPTMTDPASPLVRTLAAEIGRVLGREAACVASPGTYDQKHVTRIGHLRDCVAYGPGRLELAHQPDEWVGIADMLAAAWVMAATALRLGGSLSSG